MAKNTTYLRSQNPAMDHSTYFQNSLKNMRLLFKSMGLTFLGCPTKNIMEFLITNKFCLFNTFLMIVGFSVIVIASLKVLMVGNYKRFLFLWTIISYQSFTISKLITILFKKNIIEEMINDIKELHDKNTDKGDKDATEAIEKKEFNFLRKILILTSVLHMLVVNTFNVAPLIIMMVTYINTNEFIHITLYPVDNVYPFLDYEKNVVDLIIVYSLQVYVALLLGCAVTTADYIFFFLCTSTNIQFLKIGHRIENIVEKSKKNGKIDHEILENDLIDIIVIHQHLFKMVEMTDSIFSKKNLYNIVVSSAYICVTIFNVMNVKDQFYKFSFVILTLSVLSEVFTLCYNGDIIMRANSVFSDSIVKCDWPATSNKFKILLLIILMRSQKPCRITAYKFVNIDLQAFNKFLTTSWSYFALLNSVYSDDENEN